MGPARAVARLALIAALSTACAHKRAAERPFPTRAAEVPVPAQRAEIPASASERPKRRSPTSIARAGTRPLDAACVEPFLWPAHGVLISGFGPRENDRHEGIDLAAPEGAQVVAAADGTVTFAGEQQGYGNLVLLSHGKDLVTVYAHNARNLVVPGERVARGQVIARVGRSGNAEGPHLHFEVRVASRPRDPLGFLR